MDTACAMSPAETDPAPVPASKETFQAALAVPWFCGPARWNITTMASFCTVPKPNP